MLTRKSSTWFLFLLYIGAVMISFHFSELKYESLNFHTRDYAFYLQFASKLLDPKISKSYSLNPDGENWLRFYGSDGANEFHKTIHLEPIKYFYAVLYTFSGTPRSLFLFTALLFYLPLLYLAFILPTSRREELIPILLIAILYVFFPSSVIVPSYDLRPYIFLSAFLILALLSVAISRPLWEKLLWFNAMFLAREEALILALIVMCYAYVKIEDPSIRRKTILSLGVSWSLWALITFFFLAWSGYPTLLLQLLAKPFNLINQVNLYWPIAWLVTSLLVALFAGGAIFGWHQFNRYRGKTGFQRAAEVVTFSAVFLPLSYSFIKYELPQLVFTSAADMVQLFFLPRYHLYFAALLGVEIVLLPHASKGLPNRVGILFPVSLCLVFLFLNLFGAQSVTRLSSKYQDEIKLAEEVWALRNITDQYQSKLLVDYSTHQAFYDYQHVYAYNRLPWDVISGGDRFYPVNKPVVQKMVNVDIEYVVISKSDFNAVNEFIASSDLRAVRLFENDRFIALQLLRDS